MFMFKGFILTLQDAAVCVIPHMYTIFACKGVELLVDLKFIHSKIVKSCEKNRSLDFDYAVIRTLCF